MAVRVVDASAIAAILFGEPGADAAAAQIGAHALAAPSLLEYELGNVCWKKCRRYPHMADALRAAFQKLREFELQLHDVDVLSVLDLANQSALSVYDASYLWLARRLTVPLVTLDNELASRAAR
jgi:predicted nucleic acid-binding protein